MPLERCLQPVSKLSGSNLFIAGCSVQLCILHDEKPPTWGTAKELLRRPKFAEECCEIQPQNLKVWGCMRWLRRDSSSGPARWRCVRDSRAVA